MATIIFGNGISAMRGKIGGTIYSTGLSGAIAKNKPIILKKRSTISYGARWAVTALQAHWANMSIADKLTWSNFALFKPTQQKRNIGKFLNGQQIFLYYAVPYLNQFGTIINNPTFSTTPANIATPSITSIGGSLFLDSSLAIDETLDFAVFSISGPVRQGRVNAPGGTKRIKVVFATTSQVDITSAYNLLFGFIPSSGQYVEITWQVFSVQATNWTMRGRTVIEVG